MDDPPDPTANSPPTSNGTSLQDSKGWDGKLRLDRRAVVTNAEILSDPDYSDEDAPPIDQIVADEGKYVFCLLRVAADSGLRQTCLRTMSLTLMYAYAADWLLRLMFANLQFALRTSTLSIVAFLPYLLYVSGALFMFRYDVVANWPIDGIHKG